jgi:F-type H+-transporting ATPase subunit b
MIGRKALDRAIAGAGIALASFPAAAAEGGMPQLNFHDFPPQLVWLAIVFVILYVVLSTVALPRVGEVLQARADRISADLDRAAALKAESDQAVAAYEKALADARNQAAMVNRDTSAALAKKSAERQATVGATVAQRIKTAETNIAAAKSKALAEIQTVAADIAADVTRRLTGVQVSPGDASQAVASSMRERG